VDCGVGYEDDLEEVEKLTREVIGNAFEQKGEKEVVEFFMKEFGSSSMNFTVRFWVDAMKQREIHFARHKAVVEIKKAFDAKGFNIPFPIRTLDFDKNKFRAEKLHISNSSSE
jgi:small conductance mechanosensitive channel